MPLSVPQMTTLSLSLDGAVAEVRLNRPQQSNALNEAMWNELRVAMRWADTTPGIRAVIVTGTGRHFCAGIDLSMLAEVAQVVSHSDPARSREKLRRLVLDLQDCLSSIEQCRKPVLAAIHGACIGGAVDLVTCCDMRYASIDAMFSVREIDVGMTADVGTLQRLPRLVPEGIARELAFTGRSIDANEAATIGLVNRVYASPEELSTGVMQIARNIAAKSPLAIRGTKEMLNYGRDHSVADGLNYVATWNASMLMSSDLGEVMASAKEKRPPVFDD